MIIRQDKRPAWWRNRILWAVLALTGMLALLGIWALRPSKPGPDTLHCDMETVVDAGGNKMFVGRDGEHYRNGEQQSNTVARSGQYSCVVVEGRDFALTQELDDVNGAEEFVLTAWRYSPANSGNLIADADWGFYGTATPTGKKDINGWEEFQLKFRAPDHVRHGKLKIYVWNPKVDAAYYDDLSIKRVNKLPRPPKPVFTPADSLPVVNLVINDKDMDKLGRIREEALRKGILAANVDAWVDMRLEEAGKVWRGRLRLKGDWTDHLQGNKWSYRVALDKGGAWRRMKTFSFQSPHTRSHLREWVLHQWMKAEDVLSPEYDFVELRVNGVTRGVYAYEEHFEEELVERHHRKAGPIVKFNEEGFWEIVEKSLEDGLWFDNRVPHVQASTVDAFGMGQVMDSKRDRGDFLAATTLMNQYRDGARRVDEVFDVDKLARYYAIIDVCQAFHGLIWHNQRLYYNPVLSRMEPIAFDGYTQDGPLKWLERPFMGHGRNLRFVSHSYKEQMFSRFFGDPAFVGRYIQYLWRFTDPSYQHKLFEKLNREIDKRERWIRIEWPEYSYPRIDLSQEAKMLRQTIMPLKLSSVKAHLQGSRAGRSAYQVFNYHCLPVQVIGLGNKSGETVHALETPIYLDAYVSEHPPVSATFELQGKGSVMLFKVPGIDSVFRVEVLPWPAPEPLTTEQELFDAVVLKSNPIYTVDSARHEIVFHAGSHKTAEDILIPEGWLVVFNAGADLDLVDGAKFISKSPVVMNGSSERPVVVQSSDKRAKGFTLLKPEGKCEWRNAVFRGLGSLRHRSWKLDGGVTLYEAEVLMQNCRFVDSPAEDALSIIRSIFDIQNSTISHAAFDGLDADFSKGIISGCHVNAAGMDGLELSGSDVRIKGGKVEACKVNGLNCGDESKVHVRDLKVVGGQVGILSRDMSVVTVEGGSIHGAETGLACFQRKPEFGPAKITAKKCALQEVSTPYLIQEGSTLDLDGKVIKGRR